MGLDEGERGVRKKSRMWNRLRMVLFMLRRGVLKRRTLMQDDLQVLRKRGFKVFPKNLQFFHPHHIIRSPHGFGLHDYELSFSDSPANPSLHLTKKRLVAAQHYFPCIQPHTVESPTSNWLEQMNSIRSSEEVSSVETHQLAPGEELSTSMPAAGAGQVDIEAEEFIERFYKQIKFQRQMSLLQYQEMLARGAS